MLEKSVNSKLLFAPMRMLVDAEISLLTPKIIEHRIMGRWWNDQSLVDSLSAKQIDRSWDWNDFAIERNGIDLESEKVGAITGDGDVQGAMLISTEGVECRGDGALFVELLFTAPRNRRYLRRDGQEYFVGVGKILLAWGAWLSQELGYRGRLRLDGSPDFIAWYENRGLEKLAEEPIVYQGISYTPMYLSSTAAERLIDSAPGIGELR